MQSTPSMARKQTPNKGLTYFDITLTPDEAEVICNLKLEKTTELVQLYRDTGEHFSKDTKESTADKYKAEKYLAKAEENKKANDTYFRMASAYEAINWFNAVRLLMVRINRLLPLIHTPITRSLFAIAGLSYGIGLLIDLGVVFKTVFFPNKSDEDVTWRDRLSNILQKDGRGFRMVNNAVWFGINLAVFLLTGGFSVLLNIAGWIFDVGQEIAKKYVDVKKHENTLAKINDKIRELEEEIESNRKLETELNLKIPEIQNPLIAQLKDLQETKTQLEKKIPETKNKWWYTIAAVSCMFAGSSAFLLARQVVSTIGAVVALVGGSIFGGFCKKVYNQLPSLNLSTTKPVSTNSNQVISSKLPPAPVTKNQFPVIVVESASLKPLTTKTSCSFFKGPSFTLEDTIDTTRGLEHSSSNLSCF